ncbi:MBL fold metallo-hydrolase [Polynucleobacter sp. 30F-ANTBAC]|jgi:glyoxylase-like metal-dependent hydrolase (beta-lactamase superfamily II)|uniref:MBL fold metallo-hydrolase n=1 Tax=Polynucleobacter sp. 30F-ANTBAC TaxID=2689095 RepID=UPI001C0E3A27|nr:MBL fold metallo-hydrolase [Polynucleobacter sp. 30F-ANTBAC]MBU3600118.1 MBL fold metallo-hydrolase [Polynucleobacter sp. 30F-ANTBAC]
MNSAFDTLIFYPLGEDLPLVGEAKSLNPFVKWVRMPLPFALNHINLWLIRDRFNGIDGWTLVDCGIANEATKEAWELIFKDQLEGMPVVRVIVTHMHPDHIGLSSWLCKRWNAPLWMTMTDFIFAKWLISSDGKNVGSLVGGGGAAELFSRHGLTQQDDLEKIRARSDYFSQMVPELPTRFRRIIDHEAILIGNHEWQVVVGYGHAPEHASLWCKELNLLISGDMVLPKISTNVSVFDSEPDADPLGLYLSSLERYLELPKALMVLPSHGKPFQGLHHRIGELKQHHDDRLSETMQFCANAPAHARDLVPILFKRELDLHQLTFAMGEAIAHLNYLWRAGHLLREVCSDGVLRFSCLKSYP